MTSLYIKNKMERKEVKMAKQITMSVRPKEIKLENIEIEQGQCFINSYRIAKKYPKVAIVEGLIILIDHENKAKALPHFWNRKGNVHFDVTKEKVWIGKEETSEIKEIKYFIIKSFPHTNYKNGDVFEFCSDTYANIDAFNNLLDKKEAKIK